MSWALLNTILAVETIVIILVSINVRNMLRAINSTREWALLLDKENDDIREDVEFLCDGFHEETLALLRNFRFIIISITAAVFANILDNSITWVPYLASIGFTMISVLNIGQITGMGYTFNYLIDTAQSDLNTRVRLAELARSIAAVEHEERN